MNGFYAPHGGVGPYTECFACGYRRREHGPDDTCPDPADPEIYDEDEEKGDGLGRSIR